MCHGMAASLLGSALVCAPWNWDICICCPSTSESFTITDLKICRRWSSCLADLRGPDANSSAVSNFNWVTTCVAVMTSRPDQRRQEVELQRRPSQWLTVNNRRTAAAAAAAAADTALERWFTSAVSAANATSTQRQRQQPVHNSRAHTVQRWGVTCHVLL